MFEFEGKQTVFRLKWMLGIQEDLKQAAPRLPSKTVAAGELQNLRCRAHRYLVQVKRVLIWELFSKKLFCFKSFELLGLRCILISESLMLTLDTLDRTFENDSFLLRSH